MKVNQLPDAYAELAFQRMREDKSSTYKPSNNLVGAFDWESTPEGIMFWDDIYAAETIDELPPLPDEEDSGIDAHGTIIIDGRTYDIKLTPIEDL